MATKLSIYREAARLLGTNDIASLSENVEIRHVLDAAFDSAVLHCLGLGWWRFAVVTAAPTVTTSTTPGYPYQFAKPGDWFRTYDVAYRTARQTYPIDWHINGGLINLKFNVNVVHRYMPVVVNEALWPEVYAKSVAAYLAFECAERINQESGIKRELFQLFQDRLATAREAESLLPPLRMTEHAFEQATRQTLEEGAWKFASRTVTLVDNGIPPSPGYRHRFTKPADWVRTIHAGRTEAVTFDDAIPFRDENGSLHANTAPIIFRYVSSEAMTPLNWPEKFRETVYSLIAHGAAKASNGDVAGTYTLWRRNLSEALLKDAWNERPRRKNESRFLVARGASGFSRGAQGD